jgi:chromosome partitioning protein
LPGVSRETELLVSGDDSSAPVPEDDAASGESRSLGVSRETEAVATPPPQSVSRETDTQRQGAPASDPDPSPLVIAGAVPAADVEPLERNASSPTETPIAAAIETAVRIRSRELVGTLPKPETTRVLTIANQKGGVGKTTTTVNLAAALALHGLRVLVIDLDPQGNASTAFGIDHHADIPSVYDVLVDGKPLADVMQPVEAVDGLFCVPATIDLAGAEIELVSLVARESRLERALRRLPDAPDGEGQRFDYVFIDCPPSLGLLTVNALVAAREVLIPIQCEYYALEGLSQLLRNVELVKSHLNPDLAVSTILLTMYDGRTRLAAQVAEDVRTHFPELVLGTTIPRSVRISEAPSYGQTVMTYDPGSSGALAYLEAARELGRRGVSNEENR